MTRRPGYMLAIGSPLEHASLGRYEELVPQIYAAHRGYRLGLGNNAKSVNFLHGGLKNLTVVLAKFPSPDDVSDFWWSDAYREAYVLRKSAGRFAAVGLPGLSRDQGPVPGDAGYLVVMSNPEKPSQWRKFADAFVTGLDSHGGTLMVDAGPEAVERLESLMPGSHFIVCRFESVNAAQAAWTAIAHDFSDLYAPCEPVNVITLQGLKDDRPTPLTEQTVSA